MTILYTGSSVFPTDKIKILKTHSFINVLDTNLDVTMNTISVLPIIVPLRPSGTV